jgi:hypothetical protein
MIYRYALKCETCEQQHTVRIGLGSDSSQTHKFPCRGCNEEIALRVDLDHARRGWRVVCVENCKPVLEIAGAPIVNVDANFLIPADQQGVDMGSWRFGQMRAMYEAARREGTLVDMSAVPLTAQSSRPYRQPDYAEEWKLLRKAWSLTRNDKTKLSEKRIEKASAEFYPQHPLNSLQDWVWRLAVFLCNPSYEPLFDDAMKAIEPLNESTLLGDFRQFYGTVSEDRGTRYFTVIRDFFAAYAEFGQVYFFVAKGLRVPDDHHTTSTDFEAVKMFYGNAYEHFTLLVEYLAMLNNMLTGRRYDTFQTLTLDQYRKLDKSSRFGPFSDNAAFMAICAEANNQIRNASHHGSLAFDQAEQTIRYRSGKGGTGPERSISYAEYLLRCVRIFLQVMTLLRVELIVSTYLKVRHPILRRHSRPASGDTFFPLADTTARPRAPQPRHRTRSFRSSTLRRDAEAEPRQEFWYEQCRASNGDLPGFCRSLRQHAAQSTFMKSPSPRSSIRAA